VANFVQGCSLPLHAAQGWGLLSLPYAQSWCAFFEMIRLLKRDTEGTLTFHEFERDEVPAYAILSHTWNCDNEQEVTYDDVLLYHGQGKAGYDKIKFCASRVAEDELEYFWIDTCCINRKSEPELSEAINSMFRWYKNASCCYILISDVHWDGWSVGFPKSRWFTRGWTLQELLAPASLEFCSSDWTLLEDKSTLETTVAIITSIPIKALKGRGLSGFTTKDRLSWARNRQTKRDKDHVYRLFGLFDVTMPLVYGEGKERAFKRLHEEILKHGTSPFGPLPPYKGRFAKKK
jgi:hypothetical protein